MASEQLIRALALELEEAELTKVPAALISERYPGLSFADARSVARARDDLRIAGGQARSGYKLGWTSVAMREAFGIAAPNWGSLWRHMEVRSTCPADRFIHAKLEPEIAYVAGERLVAPINESTVLAGRGKWALALEIVDPRWPGYQFTFVDNTADNSSAAGYALGDVLDLDIDPKDVSIDFTSATGKVSAKGSAAMGSPAAAVAWLVGVLAEEGGALEPGDVVLTGGLTAPVDVFPGQRVSVFSEQLGTLELAFT